MPGRGRGARGRRRTRNASHGAEDSQQQQPKRQRVSFDNNEDNVDRGESHSVIDFEQILRASDILPRGGHVASTSSACTSDRLCSDENITRRSTEISYDNVNNTELQVQNNVSNVISPHPVELLRQTSDEIAMHVPSSLKQRICKGEYINLSLLLKGAVELADYNSVGTLYISNTGKIESRQNESKDDINSIERWTDAFIIFMDIYLSAHPLKIHELLQYFFIIRECASVHGGTFWKIYDQQFRSRQAITPVSWSYINHDLWLRCMPLRGEQKNHPQLLNFEQKKQSRPQNICIDFNRGQCKWPNCKYTHACYSCNKGHPFVNCVPNSRKNSFSANDTNSGQFSPQPRAAETDSFHGKTRGSFRRTMPYTRPHRSYYRR
jgi:hypothetical protein